MQKKRRGFSMIGSTPVVATPIAPPVKLVQALVTVAQRDVDATIVPSANLNG